MNWNDFARDVHQTAVEKGLWDKPRTFDDIVCECLVHLGRAYEEYRSGRPNCYHLCDASGDKRLECDLDDGGCSLWPGITGCEHRSHKPYGAAAELGECVLGLLDCVAQKEFSIEVFNVYVDTDFTSFICSVNWQLACIHQAVNIKDSLVHRHIGPAIRLIFSWAAQEGVDLESILRELHECSKARAGRRGGTEP